MMNKDPDNLPEDTLIKTPKELGQYLRAYRKSKGITLDKVSGLSNVSTKFLSEFERGKKTAEIGKILNVLNAIGLEIEIQPRKKRVNKQVSFPYDLK